MTVPGTPRSGDVQLPPASARFFLLLVPFCWGTYNPTLRLLYSLPSPPSPAELSGVRLSVALLPFLPVLLQAAWPREPELQPGEKPVADNTDWAAVRTASLELGGFNLLGTAGQAWGLEHTSAVHAAVLLSSINVLVPVGASISGERVQPTTWLACALILLGIGLLNADVTDDSSQLAASALQLSEGDAAVLFAALSYSAYTVRLSGYAKRVPALPLSAGKTAVLGAGCISWAIAEAIHNNIAPAVPSATAAASDASALWGGAGPDVTLIAWLCICFSALVPGSLATFLQAKGQSGVSAPEAQVILALTPVVSICIASVLLGERIGPNVMQAAAVMLTASAICVAADVRRLQQNGGVEDS